MYQIGSCQQKWFHIMHKKLYQVWSRFACFFITIISDYIFPLHKCIGVILNIKKLPSSSYFTYPTIWDKSGRHSSIHLLHLFKEALKSTCLPSSLVQSINCRLTSEKGYASLWHPAWGESRPESPCITPLSLSKWVLSLLSYLSAPWHTSLSCRTQAKSSNVQRKICD